MCMRSFKLERKKKTSESPAPAPVQPASSAGAPPPVSGQHIVRPDGTIGLGVYGAVTVTGLTIDQAHDAMEDVARKANIIASEMKESLARIKEKLKADGGGGAKS